MKDGGTWTSQTAKFKAKSQNASIAGLLAAAYLIRNEVMKGLRGGYTSGAFVTGNVMNSVTVGTPEALARGGWMVAVGTNVPYALFWEVGHQNIYLRRHVRKEVWRPAAFNNRDRAAEAFARTYKRVMDS